jgi:hypothetical protein
MLASSPVSSGPSSEEEEEIMVETVQESDVDDDESDDDPSEMTLDTLGIDNPRSTGQGLYGPEHCRVIMTTKSEGHTLFCGCIASECTRPRHQGFQQNPSKVVAVGRYMGVMNSSRNVIDGLLDTFESEEEYADLQRANLQAMSEITASHQKKLDETDLKDRSLPLVQFDLAQTNPTDDPGFKTPSSDLRRKNLAEWSEAFTPPPESPPPRLDRVAKKTKGIPKPAPTLKPAPVDNRMYTIVEKLSNRMDQFMEKQLELTTDLAQAVRGAPPAAALTPSSVTVPPVALVSATTRSPSNKKNGSQGRWYACWSSQRTAIYTSWAKVKKFTRRYRQMPYTDASLARKRRKNGWSKRRTNRRMSVRRVLPVATPV